MQILFFFFEKKGQTKVQANRTDLFTKVIEKRITVGIAFDTKNERVVAKDTLVNSRTAFPLICCDQDFPQLKSAMLFEKMPSI